MQVATDVADVAAPLGLGDDVEVSSFRQHHLRAGEEVEATARAGLGPTRALGDRGQLAMLASQQRQDAVGFTVVQAPQHHGIGLVGRHSSNCTVALPWSPRYCSMSWTAMSQFGQGPPNGGGKTPAIAPKESTLP